MSEERTLRFEIPLEDGKYLIRFYSDGTFYALRYDQPWRALAGDKLMLALCHEIERLQTPKINIRCETKSDWLIGTTTLNVIRVEREDDGSFTAVTNHWPHGDGKDL